MLVGNKTDVGERREVTFQVALGTGLCHSPRGEGGDPKVDTTTRDPVSHPPACTPHLHARHRHSYILPT